MDEDAYRNVFELFVYNYRDLNRHFTVCAKFYEQITCCYFCKDSNKGFFSQANIEM